MSSKSKQINKDKTSRQLPSFTDTFKPYTLSMNSSIEQFLRSSNLQQNPEIPRLRHKKNSLKRHLEQEQEKVVVQPVQNDLHIAKRFRSDWDLLFFSAAEPGNKIDHSGARAKRQSFLVRGKEMKSFFHLLEDEYIQEFLFMDGCKKISDKVDSSMYSKIKESPEIRQPLLYLYLLAMVFAYFKRAGLKIREYTLMNFFIALYLANDMEEDEEEMKYEIFPWALGDKWRDKFPKFLLKKDKLWMKIDHRAVVSRRCCDEIMAIESDHPVWKRTRQDHHGGALRNYLKPEDDDGYPRGPNASPRICRDCDAGSGYDSASPESVSWYVSSGDSSEDLEDNFFEKPDQSTFDMKGLKKTLPENKGPAVEE